MLAALVLMFVSNFMGGISYWYSPNMCLDLADSSLHHTASIYKKLFPWYT